MKPEQDGVAEVEVFPPTMLNLPASSFSVCVRKFKQYGRNPDSMPFLQSTWMQTR